MELLQYYHSARCGEIFCYEGVEIDSTGDSFTQSVLTIPICCLGTVLIESYNPKEFSYEYFSIIMQNRRLFLLLEAFLASRSLQDDKPIETRGRPRSQHDSEVMPILIAFHQSGFRTFKHFYEKYVCVYWCAELPNLVSYSWFVQLKKEVLQLLMIFLDVHKGECSGTSFVESTRLRVCDNKRISAHRVFAEYGVGRSKTFK